MIVEDPWLAGVFGRPVFRIDAGGAGPVGERIQAHARAQASALYYVKVDTAATALVRELGDAGLSVVDVNVTLDRGPAAPPAPALAGVVSDVRPEQHAAVLDIAGRAFRYSRFHLDPRIPRALAHRVKREWIASYLAGRRGERLLVATVDGRPAGFLAVLVSETAGKVVRVIDLVAVAPEAQGLGVGTALVSAFAGLASGTSDILRVGTQVANVPSLRLYARGGFQIVRSAYVMHLHVGPPLREAA